MKNIKTQKIHTFPERELYGEFCATSLLELRIKIVTGEIKEKLCFIDKAGCAHVYDEFAIPDKFSSEDLEEYTNSLLHKMIKAQCELRKYNEVK